MQWSGFIHCRQRKRASLTAPLMTCSLPIGNRSTISVIRTRDRCGPAGLSYSNYSTSGAGPQADYSLRHTRVSHWWNLYCRLTPICLLVTAHRVAPTNKYSNTKQFEYRVGRLLQHEYLQRNISRRTMSIFCYHCTRRPSFVRLHRKQYDQIAKPICKYVLLTNMKSWRLVLSLEKIEKRNKI